MDLSLNLSWFANVRGARRFCRDNGHGVTGHRGRIAGRLRGYRGATATRWPRTSATRNAVKGPLEGVVIGFYFPQQPYIEIYPLLEALNVNPKHLFLESS